MTYVLYFADAGDAAHKAGYSVPQDAQPVVVEHVSTHDGTQMWSMRIATIMHKDTFDTIDAPAALSAHVLEISGGNYMSACWVHKWWTTKPHRTSAGRLVQTTRRRDGRNFVIGDCRWVLIPTRKSTRYTDIQTTGAYNA